MLDSFCCLRSLNFGAEKQNRFPESGMDAGKFIRFCGVVVDLHMHNMCVLVVFIALWLPLTLVM